MLRASLLAEGLGRTADFANCADRNDGPWPPNLFSKYIYLPPMAPRTGRHRPINLLSKWRVFSARGHGMTSARLRQVLKNRTGAQISYFRVQCEFMLWHALHKIKIITGLCLT